MTYLPYGDSRSSTGTFGTDRKFTGQRLDTTGLYFYNARYYDPGIGRFISADTIVPAPEDPQGFNRYSYVTNNPLRYTDPYGWWTLGLGININIGAGGGFSFSVMVVWDGQGGKAISIGKGGGSYAGVDGSVTVQVQGTSADSVRDLEGFVVQTGASGTLPNTGVAHAGVTSGGEWVVGKDYQGANVNVGIGAGIGPGEAHSLIEHTSLIMITEGSAESSAEEEVYLLNEL